MKLLSRVGLIATSSLLFSCVSESVKTEQKSVENTTENSKVVQTKIDASTGEFQVRIPVTGRYVVKVYSTDSQDSIWVEDYINNQDGRTYNITGNIAISSDNHGEKIGSPMAKGVHQLRIHNLAKVDSVSFELFQTIPETKDTLIQSMEGEEWELVWSDEFEGKGLPDSNKWTQNLGNWGWGNNELQNYTKSDLNNARLENGTLIIEASKDAEGKWSSARLTTQGKTAFKYGRIEYRAKVPSARGVWSAGWLLGDAYRDEISWPYCGEIDVLECVGYEINDSTGRGTNHATCHTRAYYFKQNNQIGSVIEVDSMHTKFHTYAVEWYPNKIEGYLDGQLYYTYDKIANELEWPFHQPQNIIVNLAIGGGWGGREGLAKFKNAQFILDYVRVYQKK